MRRLIPFLAALLVALAGAAVPDRAQASHTKTAPLEIFSGLNTASGRFASVSASRVWEKSLWLGKAASDVVSFTFADDLVSQTRYDQAGTPTTAFVQVDGFGSTRWVTDESGAITDSIDYDAFGVEIGREGTTDIEHLYRGEAFDPNVGFYYLRARWMDPDNGRFLTLDTFAGFAHDPRSLHKYLYANSDPVGFVDPSGHSANLLESSIVSKIQGSAANGAMASFRVVLRKGVDKCMCVAVTEVAQHVVMEALSGGIYILVDGGAAYAGRTNDFDRRYKEHVRDIMKNIKGTLARFKFEGSRRDLRLLEQFFFDMLKKHSVATTNDVRAIAEHGGSKNTRELRKLLGGLEFCKS